MILKKSSGIDEFGGLIWQLVVALFVAWLIVLVLIIKGVKGAGKVVYVTTSFPYILLLILGIQGWRLEGALQGIEYFVTPKMSKLLDIGVWYDAASKKNLTTKMNKT